MNLTYANSPRWANAENTLIDIAVKWDEMAGEIPFTASATDVEEYGRKLFEAAVAGEFGSIAAYVPTTAEPQLSRRFTSLEFLDLFTKDEQLAVVTASMSSASVKLWYDRTIAASFVTLDDQRTELGLGALVAAGLLTPQRKAEIVGVMQ